MFNVMDQCAGTTFRSESRCYACAPIISVLRASVGSTELGSTDKLCWISSPSFLISLRNSDGL